MTQDELVEDLGREIRQEMRAWKMTPATDGRVALARGQREHVYPSVIEAAAVLHRAIGRAAIDAISSKGLAVVPVEPTPRMVIAGASARPTANRMNTLTADAVYRAMLAAAPKEGA